MPLGSRSQKRKLRAGKLSRKQQHKKPKSKVNKKHCKGGVKKSVSNLRKKIKGGRVTFTATYFGGKDLGFSPVDSADNIEFSNINEQLGEVMRPGQDVKPEVN